MAQERTFTLVGNFTDNISPKLKKITASVNTLYKSLDRIADTKKTFTGVTKSIEQTFIANKKLSEGIRSLRSDLSKTTSGVNDYNQSFSRSLKTMEFYRQGVGKVVGANSRLLDSIAEVRKAEENRWTDAGRAMEEYAKAQGEILNQARRGPGGRGIGGGGEDLLGTLLKANALTAIGDAIAQGFNRGMGLIMRTVGAIPSFFMRQFKAAQEDEMSDIKAQAGMMGALNLAGYKGGAAGGAVGYGEAGKFYKKIDQAIAEEIRTSAAPTSSVIELQRFTSDTLVPLLMKAQGIEKGADVRKVDPQKINEMSKGYAGLLSQVALLAQGTGSATFRVAQGVEGLITRGKIDTTMDFFTDNVLLMNALQKAGFAGGPSGKRVASLVSEADRLKALKEALQVAMPKEGIEAMSTSMTGVMQALGDTISNPSVGLFGMASTFTEKEQVRVNKQLKTIFDARYAKYGAELQQLKSSGKQDQDTLLRIKQLEIDRRKNRERLADLTKQGEEKVTTPFKAFSLVFGQIIANFTKVLNAIGPIWNRFAVVALDFTDKIFGPLAESLGNIASDMNKDMAEGKERIPFHMGRAVGEIFKTLGDALGALAHLLGDPKGPMSKAQTEFYKGFMAAFKDNPALVEKAKQGIADGINAVLKKLFDVVLTIVTASEIRPLVLLALGAIFGPPLVIGVISAVAPMMIAWFGRMLFELGKRVILGKEVATGAEAAGAAARGAAAGAGASRGSAKAGRGAGRAGFLQNMFVTRRGAARARMMRYRLRQAGQFTGEAGQLAYNWMNRPGAAALGRLGAGAGRAASGIGRAAKGIGRALPGGALAFGAIDAASRMASGEDAGKAIGGAAASTIGATLGGILGQILIPVPGLGAAIGSVAGGLIGDKIYQGILGPTTEQKNAANLQLEAAIKQQQAAGIAKSGVNVDKAGGAFLLGSAQELAQRLNLLGLQANTSVRSFQALYRIDQEKQSAAQNTADALNKEIARLQALGRPSAEIADRVRELQARYNRAKTEAETSLTNLNKAWSKLGPETSQTILNSFKNMPVGQVEAAIAARIRAASMAGARVPTPQPSAGGRGAPPTPSPKGRAESMRESAARAGSPTDKKSSAEPVPPALALIAPSATSASQANIFLARTTTTSAEGIKGTLSQQIVSYKKMTTSWEMSNVSSQGKLSGAANTFAAALNSAASKIKAASASPLGGNLMASNKWDGKNKSPTGIGEAIAQEQKHMPSGAHLVIANSSETIIPANKRKGMVENAADGINLGGMVTGLDRFTQKMNVIGKMADELGGVGGLGNIKSVGKWLLSIGLQVGENPFFQYGLGFLPGGGGRVGRHAPNSYHYSGRALDVAGSPGLLDRAYQVLRRTNPRELLWRTAGHFDHLHVAYANGLGNPTLFSSASAAAEYERKMAPVGAKVATVTTNSSEGFGGSYTLNAPVTIYQQPYQDPEELATMVAMRISMAVDEMRNHG